MEDIPRDVFHQIFYDYLSIEDIFAFTELSHFTKSLGTSSFYEKLGQKHGIQAPKREWQSWRSHIRQFRPTNFDEDFISAIVLDCGSGYTKAGYAGEDDPRCCFPTIVSRPKTKPVMVCDSKDSYVGFEALSHSGRLTSKYPIQHGVITNWDDLEKIWHTAFYEELRTPPEEHPILLNEPHLNPKANKEKQTQIIFETFNAPATYFADPCSLALYATGRGTGVVVDVGAGKICINPISQGYSINQAITRRNMGGSDITQYLFSNLLRERGYNFETTAEFQIVERLKKRLCYVAADFDEEIVAEQCSSSFQREFTMPDKQKLIISDERFRALEPYFLPQFLDYEFHGLPQTIYESILKTDVDLRKDLYSQIILVGGESVYPGFVRRVTEDLRKYAPPLATVYATNLSFQTRRFAPWIGGSILASLTTFQQMWISKEEYDESGPHVNRRRKIF